MPTAMTDRSRRATRRGVLRVSRICTVLVILATGVTNGQDAKTESASGFQMAAPEGWHSMTRHDVVDNVKKLTFLREIAVVAGRFLACHRSRGVPKVWSGGTQWPGSQVQVDLIRHTARTFEQFRSTIVRSTEELKKVLDGFELTEPPRVVQVGGRQAVLVNLAFQIGAENVGTLKVRSRVYAVPNGDTFFQISFADGPDDDCSALFDELVRTIRFE